MIKKLLEYYDERLFAWLEGKSPSRSKSSRETGTSPASRSEVPDGCVVPPSNEIEIPDPWD